MVIANLQQPNGENRHMLTNVVGRWLLMAHMEMGLQQQRQSLGFSNRDIDDVRRLIADTNPVLLGK